MLSLRYQQEEQTARVLRMISISKLTVMRRWYDHGCGWRGRACSVVGVGCSEFAVYLGIVWWVWHGRRMVGVVVLGVA